MFVREVANRLAKPCHIIAAEENLGNFTTGFFSDVASPLREFPYSAGGESYNPKDQSAAQGCHRDVTCNTATENRFFSKFTGFVIMV